MRLEEWIDLGARLGLEGLDFSIRFLSSQESAYLEGLRRRVEEAGLSLCMIACYSDFTQPDPAERRRQVEEMQRHLDAAAQLGASFVRVTAGQGRPGLDRTQGIEWVVDGLHQLLDHAAGLPLQLVMENHTRPSVWEYADFAQPLDIFFTLLDRLRETALGVNFDTANTLVVQADPLEVLNRVRHKLLTVHASDTRQRGKLDPVVLGTGLVPFPAIFRALKEQGFDGWICLEEASGQGEAGLRQAISYVRQAWGEA